MKFYEFAHENAAVFCVYLDRFAFDWLDQHKKNCMSCECSVALELSLDFLYNINNQSIYMFRVEKNND